jgi:predicted ATP-dependent endonuclease of OLD family
MVLTTTLLGEWVPRCGSQKMLYRTLELVEFGMNDVKKAIDGVLETIRTYQLIGTTDLSLGYLGDVVSQTYKTSDSDVFSYASEATIDAILNRIDDAILSTSNKSRLREIIMEAKTTSHVPSEHEKIIYHYFTKLITFQSELEKREGNIKEFCELCSEYMTDKEVIYESGRFSFGIFRNRNGKIDQNEKINLSSGEKQVVSLFSHLYLSGQSRFFVLIDEPELSLSVPWQRRFLIDIKKGSFCAGLIAVTHSPFIYDNELRQSTRAIGEFISGPDWGNTR